MNKIKVIILDDDPTGSQTVHSCLLLTRWDSATLVEGLRDSSPLLFILTNTRGMDADEAAAVTRDVCRNLSVAFNHLEASGENLHPIFVSRSDSTLRGHYPVETDIIAEELGPFDAHFVIPAFFEGGRITSDSTHFVVQNGRAIPAHETEFAKDSVFGYHHSYLPDYIEEKTAGRIRSADVRRFLLSDIHGDIRDRLLKLVGNIPCVVDAIEQSDLDKFSAQLLKVVSTGKRFLFRSAASILTSFAALPGQPVAPENMSEYVIGHKPGVILVGSYVAKSTRQLGTLLDETNVVGIEVDVDKIANQRGEILHEVARKTSLAHQSGKTPVIFTSRAERICATKEERLGFGKQVSNLLMEIVRCLPQSIGYLVSKGGITSNDVLSFGLSLRTSRVLGQILPGCSVVRCPSNHPTHPLMPVVIFPGNVGDERALADVYRRLSSMP